jgi:hypothetical protein
LIQFATETGDIFLLPTAQADSGNRLSSYLMGTRELFPWGMKLIAHIHLVPN